MLRARLQRGAFHLVEPLRSTAIDHNAKAATAEALTRIRSWALPHKDNVFEVEKTVDVTALMDGYGCSLKLTKATGKKPFRFVCDDVPADRCGRRRLAAGRAPHHRRATASRTARTSRVTFSRRSIDMPEAATRVSPRHAHRSCI